MLAPATTATESAVILENVAADPPNVVMNIETDDALHAAYLERIPVICLDGEHVSDYFLDEPTLTARLNSDG